VLEIDPEVLLVLISAVDNDAIANFTSLFGDKYRMPKKTVCSSKLEAAKD
jgi:hypothetical protein